MACEGGEFYFFLRNTGDVTSIPESKITDSGVAARKRAISGFHPSCGQGAQFVRFWYVLFRVITSTFLAGAITVAVARWVTPSGRFSKTASSDTGSLGLPKVDTTVAFSKAFEAES